MTGAWRSLRYFVLGFLTSLGASIHVVTWGMGTFWSWAWPA